MKASVTATWIRSNIRLFALLTIISMLPILCFAQPSNLVTTPVNPASRIALQGQRPTWAVPENDQSPVAGDTLLEHLTLVLKRSPRQQKALEKFLQQLQDPASPNYHHWLTPVQFGKRFGAPQHDIDAVSGWLLSRGLRVNGVANNRVMVDFSGEAAQVGAAFATELRHYVVNGEQRMGAADDPHIPAALSGVIQSISGLYTVNDHPFNGMEQVQVPANGAGSELPALSLCNSGPCTYFVTPLDFSTIYDVNSVWNTNISGAGQTIAIIGRAKVFLADVTNFESLSGIPSNLPTVIVPPNGVDPGPPAGTGGKASGDQGEATLDVMRSASVATGATIDLVVSADSNTVSGLRIAAQYVVDANPVIAQVMSISFGACEADRTQADVQFWDGIFSQGAAEGISTFVASGDGGAAGCDAYFQAPPATQIASPNYICSSSYCTCVGGTEFAEGSNPSQYWSSGNNGLESALSYIPEGGWNEPLNINPPPTYWVASSGGGVSAYIPTPSWQTGPGVPGTQGRYTPDIAFTSAAHDGYFGCLAASGGTHPGDCVVRNGSFYFEYFFGTSAAAPDMAGITALLDQQTGSAQGELNQRLYQIAADPSNTVFHDVTVATSGVTGCVVTHPSMCNNSTASPTALTGGLSGYLVNAGFDEVTGLGSIDVANLLARWSPGSATTTTLSANPNPANFGDSVTFSAIVGTGGTNPPTGNVIFKDGSTTLGNASLSAVNGSQEATLTISTLSSGVHSITATYNGDANNAPSTSVAFTQTIQAPTMNWVANGGTTGTAMAGQSAIYNFTASPTSAGTFAGSVTFSCSGLPDATVSCSFNPTQIAANAGTTQVQVSIVTTGPNPPAGAARRHAANGRAPWLPLALPLAGIAVFGLAGRKVSRCSVVSGLCVSLALLGVLVACGGGGGSSAPPVSVSVSSGTPASLFPNNSGWPLQTAKFTATVANATNTSVTWAVTTPNGGTIDATGLYTAPTVARNNPPSVTVTATSVANPSASGSGRETLTAATVPGTYSNIMVTATESVSVYSVPVSIAVN